jgi:hypothetical protein
MKKGQSYKFKNGPLRVSPQIFRLLYVKFLQTDIPQRQNATRDESLFRK